jgi:hypothetical protein
MDIKRVAMKPDDCNNSCSHGFQRSKKKNKRKMPLQPLKDLENAA